MAYLTYEGSTAGSTSNDTAPPATLPHPHAQIPCNEHPLPNLQSRKTEALQTHPQEKTSDILHSTPRHNSNNAAPRPHPPHNPTTTPSPPHLGQLDGPQDHRPQMLPRPFPIPPQPRGPLANPRSQAPKPKCAYRDLLPYCTTETPLTEHQVIGLSDIAGSLREVMVLAVRARTDERCAKELAMAVGTDGVRGVVEFFENEFEI